MALLALPEWTPGIRLLRVGGAIVSLAFAAVIAFLVFAYRNRSRAVALATWVVRPFSARIAERVAGMLDAFIHGLRVLPGLRSLAIFFALTAAYWCLNALGMRILALGFGFDLGVAEACALLGILVVGVMIPAGPGMIGTFQGAVVVGLSLFAPADAVATRGMAYANVVWAAQLAQVTALGVAFLFSRHVELGRLTGAPPRWATGSRRRRPSTGPPATASGSRSRIVVQAAASLAATATAGALSATARSERSRPSDLSTSSRKSASSSRSIRARYSCTSAAGTS